MSNFVAARKELLQDFLVTLFMAKQISTTPLVVSTLGKDQCFILLVPCAQNCSNHFRKTKNLNFCVELYDRSFGTDPGSKERLTNKFNFTRNYNLQQPRFS